MLNVEFWEDTSVLLASEHEIDENEYKEWLDGKEASIQNLKEFIYESWNPHDQDEFYGETVNDGFDNEDEVIAFINAINDEQAD